MLIVGFSWSYKYSRRGGTPIFSDPEANIFFIPLYLYALMQDKLTFTSVVKLMNINAIDV
jgi:hypothetical protein